MTRRQRHIGDGHPSGALLPAWRAHADEHACARDVDADRTPGHVLVVPGEVWDRPVAARGTHGAST
jgi:hypothetical protein